MKRGGDVAVQRAVESAESLLNVAAVEAGILDYDAAHILQVAGPAGHELVDDYIFHRREMHAHPAEFNRRVLEFLRTLDVSPCLHRAHRETIGSAHIVPMSFGRHA